MKRITAFLLFIFLYHIGYSQVWKNLASVNAYTNRAGSFSINGDGYIFGSSNYQNAAYSYDTSTNTWASITSFPTNATDGAVGCSLNGFGYACAGTESFSFSNSFYKYDPTAGPGGTWTSLPNFPGSPRAYGVAFALDGKIYVGGGLCNFIGTTGAINYQNGYSVTPYTDFFVYDPVANTWDSIPPCPALGVSCDAVAFVIGDKAYVGTGGSVTTVDNGQSIPQRDFWEYDTTSKVWDSIAHLPGLPRAEAVAFATCDKGYVGTGYTNVSRSTDADDFWQYDPAKNKWVQIANFGGAARNGSLSFTIGKTGYVCGGSPPSGGTDFQDLWSYTAIVTPAFSATSSVCAGQSILFTDTSDYTPTNWYWQFPGGKPDISTVQIPTIEYDSAGIFSVTLTAWNGCDSGTLTFTNYVKVGAGGVLTVLPQSPKVCSGGNVTLSVTNRGTGFTWTPSSGLIDSTASGDSVVAAPAITTVYTIMGASAGGCTAIGTDTVIVDTAPPLTVSPQPPPSFCSGSNAELKVSGGGTNFIWTPSTGLSATTGDSVLASPTVTTTYAVTGKDTLGCPSSGTEKVTVFPAPIIPTVTQSGNILKSSAQYQNQWYLNDTLLVGDTSQYLTITTGGEYRVSVTNEANGCSSASDSANITTGINQLSVISAQLSIYPNPFTNNLFIKINTSAQDVKDWTLQITDVLGQTVHNQLSLNYSNAIDLSNLSSGVYFITVISKTGRAVFPVVK